MSETVTPPPTITTVKLGRCWVPLCQNFTKERELLESFGLELTTLSIQELSLFPQKYRAYEDKPLSPTNVF